MISRMIPAWWPTVQTLSGLVVVVLGIFHVGLAVASIIDPPRVERFLRAFATSPHAHYTEQIVRLIAGAAIVSFAPSMWYPVLFAWFGWIVIATTVGLLLIPWHWHRRFAAWAVPLAVRHLRLLAVGALFIGAVLLYGTSRTLLA